ncbi:MAG: Chromosome partition protein smc [Chloroflexi bacterium AL-W]|nr:Chromosome partition protein smc [Chloroflexi bacterium AL-N1]NOK64664.1 Chromosome partition protein smc [Chloroflexi bacterium AL-N10]NOK75905.1 Chromosome partition protein smc [Chloroflexi bacterium AL-N5]NOK80336.1 Chromosome partition protein smc [Chloroflexi bacterium AL-W]NOK86849.1 Chromosome partition protein smc [Chloroflexi bacterium AL-N15]
MAAPSAQVIQLTCPGCQTQLQARVFMIVDVGQQPDLKNRLLSGQLNMVVCEQCGNVSMIAAPLLYHDPDKRLFLVHFPQQLNTQPEDQEKLIGDATSLLIRNFPEDQPKAHLLAPKRFLTMNSLIEAVLEADGVSREMIEAQRKRVDLIGELATAYEESDEALTQLANQHHSELNAEFFATITAFAQASQQNGQSESAQVLLQLRDKLIEITEFEFDGAFAEDGESDLPLNELLKMLIETPDSELSQVIAEHRPAIDYSFFQALTERIDAAKQAGNSNTADQLTVRRQLILETVEQIDKQAQEMFDKSLTTLREVMEADDTAAALRERQDFIDEAFLLIVEANQAAAERSGNNEAAALLSQIRKMAVDVMRESFSPEDRLINDLLETETAQEATQLLRQNSAVVNAGFVKRINELADQVASDGQQPVGDRLRQLGREAAAMLFN